MKLISFLVSLFFTIGLLGQPFNEEEKSQGYIIHEDNVTFIFDPQLYGVDAERVTITGTFRNWDQDMNNEDWQMKKSNELWTLNIVNTDFGKIRPNNEFKFRINDGEWLSPPVTSTNEKGGNLVFMQDYEMPGLKAELKDPNTIWANVVGNRPLQIADYRITDAHGNVIPIAGVLPNTATETLITTAEPLDIKRVYFLEIPALDLKSH